MNPAPEGRPNLAQPFSAGKSGPHDSSPGEPALSEVEGTEFSRTLLNPCHQAPAKSGSDCTRCLAQKLLNVDIRARRNSTLGEIAAPTAPASDGGQHSLEQRAHVRRQTGRIARSLRGRLREDQTGWIHGACHQ